MTLSSTSTGPKRHIYGTGHRYDLEPSGDEENTVAQLGMSRAEV